MTDEPQDLIEQEWDAELGEWVDVDPAWLGIKEHYADEVSDDLPWLDDPDDSDLEGERLEDEEF